MDLLLNIFVPLSAMVASFLVVKRNPYGYLLFLIAEVSVSYVGFSSGNPGVGFLGLYYIVIDLYGFHSWSNLLKNKEK